MLDINGIKEIIPHREPFLLLSEVEILDETHIKGCWHLTGDEYFFEGHYPDQPVLPGVLMVEAAAQLGAVLVMSKDEAKGKKPFFAGIDKARFRRMVLPGETLDMEVELTEFRRGVGKGKCKGSVNGEAACDVGIMFAIK